MPSNNTHNSNYISSRSAGSSEVNGIGDKMLQISDLSKTYGDFLALDKMNFDLRSGEVHVLFGENGAGKSTLVSIICGALEASGGDVILYGDTQNMHSVKDAREKGIAAVFQEFSLAPELTVEENLFLGAELSKNWVLKKKQMHQMAETVLADLDFNLDSQSIVADLSRAECQMVEIAKAIMTNPRVLILDEPTASLTNAETQMLFQLIEKLKSEGVGIIYISHRIDEIQKIGDRVTVMRDGRFVETLDAHAATKKQLVELMTGRQFGEFFPHIEFLPGEIVLNIDKLATLDGHVSDVSLTVRAGEIVGLAGLVGCGKSEIGRACFGLSPLLAGKIHFGGLHLRHPDPSQLIKKGMGFVPSDRIKEGLMLDRSTRENLSLAALHQDRFSLRGLLKRKEERVFAKEMGERVGITPLRLEGDVAHYSGGNKQKVMFGRAIASPLKLLILDEPTIGIDVGAKAEIYALLAELVKEGLAVLLISSDLPEVLSLSNRVYVVRHGHISDELKGERKTEEEALASFFGN